VLWVRQAAVAPAGCRVAPRDAWERLLLMIAPGDPVAWTQRDMGAVTAAYSGLIAWLACRQGGPLHSMRVVNGAIQHARGGTLEKLGWSTFFAAGGYGGGMRDAVGRRSTCLLWGDAAELALGFGCGYLLRRPRNSKTRPWQRDKHPEGNVNPAVMCRVTALAAALYERCSTRSAHTQPAHECMTLAVQS
jgi:hypothetical protein